jgi:signal transduction histidine kinase
MNRDSLPRGNQSPPGPILSLGAGKVSIGDSVVREDLVSGSVAEVNEETMVYEVAHDFKNILYIIRGFAQLILDVAENNSKMHRHVQIILDAVDRGDKLVSHMLTLAEATALDKYPTDIRPIIEETVSFVRASVAESVHVHLTVSEDMPPVLANPTEIHQLLMNLCFNAAHAMQGSGGNLHVSLGRVELDATHLGLETRLKPGPYLRLTVSDTGEGIAPELMTRIFEPYFTTKKNGQGTGLGLCVVERIVKGHGGVMTVDSAVGKGTTCEAFFPTVECASVSCALRRGHLCKSVDQESETRLTTDGIQSVRIYMRRIYEDMEQLEAGLTTREVACASILDDLRVHVQELEARLTGLPAPTPHSGTYDPAESHEAGAIRG